MVPPDRPTAQYIRAETQVFSAVTAMFARALAGLRNSGLERWNLSLFFVSFASESLVYKILRLFSPPLCTFRPWRGAIYHFFPFSARRDPPLFFLGLGERPHSASAGYIPLLALRLDALHGGAR